MSTLDYLFLQQFCMDIIQVTIYPSYLGGFTSFGQGYRNIKEHSFSINFFKKEQLLIFTVV